MTHLDTFLNGERVSAGEICRASRVETLIAMNCTAFSDQKTDVFSDCYRRPYWRNLYITITLQCGSGGSLSLMRQIPSESVRPVTTFASVSFDPGS